MVALDLEAPRQPETAVCADCGHVVVRRSRRHVLPSFVSRPAACPVIVDDYHPHWGDVCGCRSPMHGR